MLKGRIFPPEQERGLGMYRIMIVEDDRAIAQALARQLEKWGYEARTVEEFDQVLERFRQLRPDLVLLDISLPFYSGYYWCAEIRKESRTPILFLSSAGDDMNLVMAINLGGDDFLAKPFSMEVMVAKIQAILRRTYDFGPDSACLRVGDALLDLTQAAVTCQGRRAELTKNEFLILKALMERKGQPVSREEMIRRLWEDESFVDDNTLTVNVTRLRKKLEGIGLKDWVKTRKGLGYLVEGEQ